MSARSTVVYQVRMLSKAHAIKNKEFAKVKSRLDAETMNSAQVDRARVEHGFCVEPCLFCFLFSVFCLLLRMSLKRGFLLCHFCLSAYLYCLFSCLLVVLCLPWTLYVLCLRTTAAYAFKWGFNVLRSLCVCVSCACIDWTVERQVSVVIVSGFFFTCSQNADVYTGFFRLIFVFDFWELCSQSGSVCSFYDSSAFLDCSVLTIMKLYHLDNE